LIRGAPSIAAGFHIDILRSFEQESGGEVHLTSPPLSSTAVKK
jgi:hypothetical protein